MFKKILIVLVALIAILVIVIALQPADFRVTRSATVAAPPEAVFSQVNNFQNWDAWSPWAKLDPNATSEFEGPQAGEGAVFRWSGNSQVGQGSNTIVESKPNELVRIQLDFVKPFEATSTAEFTFEPQGDNKTLVTWSMYGKNNFIGKAISLVMDCEKMIGPQFEQGLENLSQVAAGKPAEPAAAPDPAAPASADPQT